MSGLSGEAVAGITVAVLLLIASIIGTPFAIVWYRKKQLKLSEPESFQLPPRPHVVVEDQNLRPTGVHGYVHSAVEVPYPYSYAIINRRQIRASELPAHNPSVDGYIDIIGTTADSESN